MQEPNVILVIDDTPHYIGPLFETLTKHGFRVLVAENARNALLILKKIRPVLCLLDVIMPNEDGFEICRQIKNDAEIQDIPILFMTAKTDVETKLEAFRAGAVDYITKPIHQEEVLARVCTHARLYRLQQALHLQNQELQQKNEDLDAFAYTVAHDLKDPIHGVLAFTNILRQESDYFTAEHCQHLETILQTGKGMVDIIDALLRLARISKTAVDKQPLNMAAIFARARQRSNMMLHQSQAKIKVPETWPQVLGYATWVEEVWCNYLSNALKYGGQPPLLEVGVDSYRNGYGQTMYRFWLHDNGPGISASAQQKLFKTFSRVSRSNRGIDGHGLGLAIVKRMIENLGGEVGVNSQLGAGSTFYFSLPAQTEE